MRPCSRRLGRGSSIRPASSRNVTSLKSRDRRWQPGPSRRPALGVVSALMKGHRRHGSNRREPEQIDALGAWRLPPEAGLWRGSSGSLDQRLHVRRGRLFSARTTPDRSTAIAPTVTGSSTAIGAAASAELRRRLRPVAANSVLTRSTVRQAGSPSRWQSSPTPTEVYRDRGRCAVAELIEPRPLRYYSSGSSCRTIEVGGPGRATAVTAISPEGCADRGRRGSDQGPSTQPRHLRAGDRP